MSPAAVEAIGPMHAPILEMVDVTKSYGGFVANDRVSLSVQAGEIHALLGENGAGKSTLVKTLFGVHRPDSGAIRWRGSPVQIASPAQARALGIGMVFQHFALFETLNVAENIALAMPQNHSVASVTAALTEISRHYGLALNPNAAVGDLSAGERQRIEIVRCLMQKPELIILDEPTSVLTPQEADDLFAMLRTLAGEGRAIIYISHKLDEVRRLCHHATILRHGQVVANCVPSQVDKSELARLMVGETVHAARPSQAAAPTDVALSINGLSLPAESQFGIALRNIVFELRRGEIAAIAGIAGNGQSELFSALSGERASPNAAAIKLCGEPIGKKGITQRRKHGMAFISEERLGHGTAPDLSLSENVFVTRALTDPELLRYGFLNARKARAISDRVRSAFDVRSSEDDPAANALSGGNLQKYIVGRAVDRNPDVLIVNQPTWGVDAGAAAHIRKTLVALAERGTAIVLISQDLDEIYEIADRIAVICDGELTPFYPRDQVTPEQIGIWMSEAPVHAA